MDQVHDWHICVQRIRRMCVVYDGHIPRCDFPLEIICHILIMLPSRDPQAILLDLNEFAFDHHPHLVSVAATTRYPDRGVAKRLLKALDKPNALVTAGADEAILLLVDTLVRSDTRVYLFAPTYDYAANLFSERSQTVIEVSHGPLVPPLRFYDTGGYAVVYLVNPNNPFGTLWSRHEVLAAARAFPHMLWIIDEAYMEFSSTDESVCGAHDVDNIVVVKTFSKAFGLAGERLGYCVVNDPKILDALQPLVQGEFRRS